MASDHQKREICRALQKTMLEVCRSMVPFEQSLELHGLVLLETDGREFCTVSFKDVKVEAGARDGSKFINIDSECELSQSSVKSQSENFNPENSASVVNDFLKVWGDKSNSQSSKQSDAWMHLNWTRKKNKNNKYECPACRKEFTFATNLTRHQRSHHGRPLLRKPVEKRRTSTSSNACDEVMSIHSYSSDEDHVLIKSNRDEANNNQEHSLKYDLSSSKSSLFNANSSMTIPQGDSSLTLQGSDLPLAIESANTYIAPSFQPEDMYFSLPDAVPLPDDPPLHSETQLDKTAENIIDRNSLQQEVKDKPVHDENNSSIMKVNLVFETTSGKQYRNAEETSDNSDGNFVCPMCSRKFNLYQNLGRHSQVSHGMSIFELEMKYGKKSTDLSNCGLSAGTIKGFVCDICGNSFTFRSNLSRHKSKHHSSEFTQDKAIVSKDVNQATPTDNGEKSTGKHKCDICGALFQFTSSLSRHMRKKHNLVRTNTASSQKSNKANPSTANSGAQFAVPLIELHPYSVSNIVSAPNDQTQDFGTAVQSTTFDVQNKNSSSVINIPVNVCGSTTAMTTTTSANVTMTNICSEGFQPFPETPTSIKNKKSDKGSKRHKSGAPKSTSQEILTSGKSPDITKTTPKSSKSPQKSPASSDKHQCKICLQNFSFRTNLTRHTRKVHGTYPGGPEDSMSSLSSSV